MQSLRIEEDGVSCELFSTSSVAVNAGDVHAKLQKKGWSATLESEAEKEIESVMREVRTLSYERIAALTMALLAYGSYTLSLRTTRRQVTRTGQLRYGRVP